MLNFRDDQTYLTFDDVSILPQYNPVNSRKDVDTSFKGLLGGFTMPIIGSPMDTVVGGEMLIALNNFGCSGILHRFMEHGELIEIIKKFYNNYSENYSVDDLSNTYAFRHLILSAGVKSNLKELLHYARNICIDVANGYTDSVARLIQECKRINPECVVIAGSVATREGARYLAENGADIIRVGISSGSNCSTRLVTGHGVPQLTAISECADEADILSDELGRKIETISDGGHRTGADIAKSLLAGADYVMLGGMLGATTEAPGNTVDFNGNKFKIVRGMSSKEVNEQLGKTHATAEGVSHFRPYKGSVVTILNEIKAGLCSAFTYSGAKNIEQFKQNGKFIRVSHAGNYEGTPHGTK